MASSSLTSGISGDKKGQDSVDWVMYSGNLDQACYKGVGDPMVLTHIGLSHPAKPKDPMIVTNASVAAIGWRRLGMTEVGLRTVLSMRALIVSVVVVKFLWDRAERVERGGGTTRLNCVVAELLIVPAASIAAALPCRDRRGVPRPAPLPALLLPATLRRCAPTTASSEGMTATLEARHCTVPSAAGPVPRTGGKFEGAVSRLGRLRRNQAAATRGALTVAVSQPWSMQRRRRPPRQPTAADGISFSGFRSSTIGSANNNSRRLPTGETCT